MLALAGQTKWVTLEPFIEGVKTEFEITTANAVEWAVLQGTIEAKQRAVMQTGRAMDSSEVTQAGAEALAVGLAGYIKRIRHLAVEGEQVEGFDAVAEVLKTKLLPWCLERLKDLVNGTLSLSHYEKKASGSPLDPGPSTTEPLTPPPA